MAVAQVNEKSVFVRLNEYREIVGILNNLKEKLDEAKATLTQISDLKAEEETEIELWHNNMAELEKKIAFIENTVLEPSAR